MPDEISGKYRGAWLERRISIYYNSSDTFQTINGLTQLSSPTRILLDTNKHMENLNLHDAGARQSPGMQQMQPGPPPVPQLPPQMFTTAAQLLDLTDKKLMISLRDGRKLIGVLRSWDQFGKAKD